MVRVKASVDIAALTAFRECVVFPALRVRTEISRIWGVGRPRSGTRCEVLEMRLLAGGGVRPGECLRSGPVCWQRELVRCSHAAAARVAAFIWLRRSGDVGIENAASASGANRLTITMIAE